MENLNPRVPILWEHSLTILNRSLLPSGLMADVPCLDHSLDGCKGYPDDVQTTKHARQMHAWSKCARTSLGAHVSPFRQEFLMDVSFAQAGLYLSKIAASHFSTLNTIFANRNVLKRILIAILNENKANCNENFRICAEEPVAPLYKR